MSLSKSSIREFVGDPVTGGLGGTFRMGRYDLDIKVSPSTRHPVVRVVPLNDSEVSLKAAREAEISQHGNRLLVKLPKDDVSGHSGMMIGGGGYANINGVHYRGPVTIVDGVVYQGQDAVVASRSGIRVEATLPAGSSADIESVSGGAMIDGGLHDLRFFSVSGDVAADAAHTLSINTTSGRVELGEVMHSGSLNTISGSVEIRHYNGQAMSVESVSGSVRVTAGQQAQGVLDINTVSGSITTRNTGGLRIRPRTVSGRVREN